MSVTSEIQRLQSAKADLKTAIENKGVSVSSGATLDSYAEYVGQISGGGGGADYGALIDGSISALTESDFGSATSIRNYAFYGCSALASIDIPSGVTSVGTKAFDGCNSLLSLDLNQVSSIGNDIFGEYVGDIISLTANSITYMPHLSGPYEIYCTSLEEFEASCFDNYSDKHNLDIYLGSTPPVFGKYGPFNSKGAPNYTFYVPNGSLSDYQNAWSGTDYVNHLVEMSE